MNQENLASSLAAILVGSGIVSVVLLFADLELLLAATIWLFIPFFAILGGLGLVSWGTIQAIFSADFKARVMTHILDLQGQKS